MSVDIKASAEEVWARLTDARGFASWNSTVQSIEGPMEPGNRLAIQVPAAPGRTFRPDVVGFDPPHRMTWREGSMPMFRGYAGGFTRNYAAHRSYGGAQLWHAGAYGRAPRRSRHSCSVSTRPAT